jgi:hypothetical protein
MPGRTGFVDETKATGYRMALVVISNGNLGGARATLRGQLKAGQRSLHFRTASDRRRRAILSAMLSIQWQGFVVLVDAPDSLTARATCLRKVADLSVDHRASRIVIERDDSALEHDRRVLFSYLANHEAESRIRYEHVGRHEEPLLWIADAVAWSVARGGEWRRRLSGRVIETRVGE